MNERSKYPAWMRCDHIFLAGYHDGERCRSGATVKRTGGHFCFRHDPTPETANPWGINRCRGQRFDAATLRITGRCWNRASDGDFCRVHSPRNARRRTGKKIMAAVEFVRSFGYVVTMPEGE